MAQLKFYATSQDIADLIDFMFTISSIKLYEAYSKINFDIREFRGGKEIVASEHLQNNHGAIFVRGWWKNVTPRGYIREINLNPHIGEKRYVLEGFGTFQIQQGRLSAADSNVMEYSVFSHWNEAGARARVDCTSEDLNQIDWKEFRRLSGIVHRYLRNKICVAKLRAYPILPGAFDFIKKGGLLHWHPDMFSLDSAEIEIVKL